MLDEASPVRRNEDPAITIFDLHRLEPPLEPDEEFEVAGIRLVIGLGLDGGKAAFSTPRGMTIP